MRHAQDGAALAMSAVSRVLMVRGRNEPQELENPDVAWAARARDGVWAPTKDGQRIHIGIDCSSGDRPAMVIRPSLRVYVGIEKDTDIVAQTTASGVRLLTIVHSADAPTEFRFPITLADGLDLEVMPSGGFDVVHLRYGATVGRFYTPWACDSMFRQINAEYRLEGSTMVMRVSHEGATYPVVADPLYAR